MGPGYPLFRALPGSTRACRCAPRTGQQSAAEHGWALVTTVERVVRSRLIDKVGEATPAEIAQVTNGLRVALALDPPPA